MYVGMHLFIYECHFPENIAVRGAYLERRIPFCSMHQNVLHFLYLLDLNV